MPLRLRREQSWGKTQWRCSNAATCCCGHGSSAWVGDNHNSTACGKLKFTTLREGERPAESLNRPGYQTTGLCRLLGRSAVENVLWFFLRPWQKVTHGVNACLNRRRMTVKAWNPTHVVFANRNRLPNKPPARCRICRYSMHPLPSAKPHPCCQKLFLSIPPAAALRPPCFFGRLEDKIRYRFGRQHDHSYLGTREGELDLQDQHQSHDQAHADDQGGQVHHEPPGRRAQHGGQVSTHRSPPPPPPPPPASPPPVEAPLMPHDGPLTGGVGTVDRRKRGFGASLAWFFLPPWPKVTHGVETSS